MSKKRKKLLLSRKNKMVTGLLGGVGEYLNVDATLLRIIWLVFIAITGFIPGIFAYFVASMVVPKK